MYFYRESLHNVSNVKDGRQLLDTNVYSVFHKCSFSDVYVFVYKIQLYHEPVI